jgi:hypothetical protein
VSSIQFQLSPEDEVVARRLAGWLRMENRAVKSPEIERVFRISGVTVRAMIHWLRTQGNPDLSRIGSDTDGYRWLSHYDPHVVANLRSRAKSIEAAGVGICRSFGRDWDDPDQTELELM